MAETIEQIADELIESQSDVSEYAVDAEMNKERDFNDSVSGLTCKNGRTFDPSIHKVDSTGNPILTAKGRLSCKPGARPGTNSGTNKSTVSDGIQQRQESSQPNPMECRQSAIATVEMLSTLCKIMGGPDWELNINKSVNKVDEREAGYDAFTAYYQAKEITDIPPGVIVLSWMIMYAAPRFSMPETKTRFTRLKAKIFLFFNRKKGIKQTETKTDRKEQRSAESKEATH